MGRARGGNALLEYKGGHEVGDGAFQRLSLDAAHSKVEVAASVAGTRLPNQTKPNQIMWGCAILQPWRFDHQTNQIGVECSPNINLYSRS